MNQSETKALEALQNGSDIRGIAIATEKYQITLTDERVEKIAYGFAKWLKEEKKVEGQAKVAIGHDSRLSAERLKAALVKGLTFAGIDVVDVGLATTPAMFMATQYEDYDCDAGIMITASHLPFMYNGLKLFTKSGGAEHEDIDYIVAHADKSFIENGLNLGKVTKQDLLSTYAADLTDKIRAGITDAADKMKPLQGSHIIVDAGNGAGGFFAEKVLAELGADISESQFLDPDGNFPNHIPNPDNEEAMASLKKAVLASGADLGVIFDTDVDRAAIMDKNGESLNRNPLIAVISSIILEEKPGTTIVTDSTTSGHLQAFIEAKGGKQHRFKRGYRNVINEALRLNANGTPSEIAIEVSGHAALKENYFLDDGAYLIAKILMTYATLRKKGQDLPDLIADLKEPAESEEIRLSITATDFKAYGKEALADFLTFVEADPDMELEPVNQEGIRVNTKGALGEGWFLLRMSLHEPVMPMNLESDEAGGIRKVKDRLAGFFATKADLKM
ncbi:TPA: phosphomannomutase/phosphoglucomutase [Listeria monocytogenes]|uniref:Phosphomannomutase/phosphoglucomutase n=18 Tax=Listeria monocytogenes TaxID=1639 RepID=A0A3T2AE10_LISMN|nr:phosphoglucomutase [Listeria monocytogenes]EAF3064716.1 phosphomannomutase/phosphoglucomutase [Listeria monocytogenes serotype 1/2a]EAF4518681.1 phosphomannomutase/phosphoglucomutase [Listeria monocytogenes serotype 4b]AEO39402.1 phosphoglucomutase/phosphomannomutase [Listeria monocytogenes Finland 1998]AGR01685.1 phosphoglucomutase [Listeria monocytogenes]AQP77165.1 phosphomannomutase/phosphoglucomutase [Listeria monocytogenes]